MEQRREELPVGESQQRHARQSQQQPRLPPAEHKVMPEGTVHGLFLRAPGQVPVVILRRHWPDEEKDPATFGRPMGSTTVAGGEMAQVST